MNDHLDASLRAGLGLFKTGALRRWDGAPTSLTCAGSCCRRRNARPL